MQNAAAIFDTTLADALPHIVWTATPKGSVDFLNKRWHEFAGTGKQSWLDLIHPDDATHTNSRWQAAVRVGTPFETECRIKKPNTQTYRWFRIEATLQPMNGNGGKWIGTCIDIQRQKENEQRLLNERDDLKDFVEQGSLGLHWVGPDGIIQWANEADYLPLGYSRDEYVGQHIAKFHADADKIESILTRLAGNEPLTNEEARLRCKDGSVRYVLINSNVRWENGNFRHTRCFTRDVTDRVLAEQTEAELQRQLRALFNKTTDAILLADDAGRYVRANPAAEKMLGYTRDELLQLTVSDVVVETQATSKDEMWSRFIHDGHQAGTITLRRKDGTNVLCDFNATANVLPGLHLSILTDVTERRQTEAELQRTQEQLQLAHEVADIGIWHHDLATDAFKLDERARNHYGFETHDLTFADVFKRLHPDDVDRLGREFAAATAPDASGSYSTEYRVIHPDGSVHWLSIGVRVWFEGEGSDRRAAIGFGTTQDITERKQTEEKMRFLVELNQALTRVAEPEGIMSLTAQMLGEHLRVNRCAYAEVIANEDDFNLFGDYTRDTFSIVGTYKMSDFGTEVLRLMRANEPYIVHDVQNDPRTADVRGAYKQTDIAAVICLPLHKDGKFVAAMAVHQKKPRRWTQHEIELTQLVVSRCWEALERARTGNALRLSDERWHLATLAAKMFSWETNRKTSTVAWSENASEVIGCKPGDVPTDAKDALFFVLPDERTRLYMIFEQSFAKQERHYTQEFIGLDGETVWQAQGTIIYDSYGKPERIIGVTQNVTDRKKAEEQLRDSERNLQNMADTIPQLAWMANPDGFIFWYNQRWYEYTGTTPEQMEGWGWQSVHDETMLPLVLAKWKHSIATGTTFDMEFPLRGSDGVYRWFLTQVNPLRDSQGTIVRWFGTNTDVDERRSARVNAEFLDRLGQALSNHLDETAIVTFAAQTVGEHFGVAQCAFPELDVPNNAAYVVDDWRANSNDPSYKGNYKLDEFLNADFVATLQDGKCVAIDDVETDARTKALAESYRQFSVGSFLIGPYIAAGVLKGALVVYNRAAHSWRNSNADLLREVVDRVWTRIQNVRVEERLRKSELRFRAIVNQATAGISQVNAEGYFLFANDRYCEIVGYTRDELLRLRMQDISEPEVLDHNIRLFKRLWSHGESFAIEKQYIRKDGSRVWVNNSVAPVLDTDGKTESVVCVTLDVTERKNFERVLEQRVDERTEQLRDTNSQLERSNQELEQFAYIASHDLQEPLRKIQTFADRLQVHSGNSLDTNGSLYLGKINDASKRMNALIRDVLDYSRLSRSAEPFVPVNLNDVLHNVLSDYELTIEQANARVTTENMPVIDAVPLQMNQLFSNLVGNALKFTAPDRTPEVNVTCRDASREELQRLGLNTHTPHYVISVIDNGIGFSPEYAEQIFVIFQRLHGRHAFAGTGIGLALCRKIALNHGGIIHAESDEGNGAAFHVVMPLRQL